ncbi:MAG: hypothetical protein GY722_13275 [bacterium]|nr:hypothetical protein [bacterium]
MLQMLKTELAAQQTAIVEECGPDSPTDADSPWLLFRSGNHQQIFARFDELESTVQPRGILGPPEEKEFWMLSQFMVRICFMKGKLADGLSRLGDYEQGRIAVKLTPMPDYDIQEAVLGHLAGRSITEALSRLQFWLDHSRMPTVSDVISNHPSFKHLFEEQVQ